jgi:16S rRNA (uracil1498-N3)-methyltransferase
MQLFYASDITDKFIQLDESESFHAIKVLRLTQGSLVSVVDGNGRFFETEIIDPDHKKCRLRIIHSIEDFGKKEYSIHIAIAPTKNQERFEWFTEKAAEIGINEITPIICSHSERKVFKTERTERILISAMKQSVKAYLPKINQPLTFRKFLDIPFTGKKFIAYCGTGERQHLKNLVARNENVLIMIGPEGDFSEEEVKMAATSGFLEISLGGSRLRTETAGLIACHIINLINE